MRYLKKRIAKDESGITLIELLVAVMLLGILLAVVASLYVSSLRSVALGRELTQNTKVASNAMNESARVIRAGTENPLTPPAVNAPAFVTAKKDDIVIYAYINLDSSEEQPQMIRLRVDRTTGDYVESRWPATSVAGGRWTFPSNPCEKAGVPSGCSAPTSRKTIASTIPASHGSVFRFFKKNGDEIVPPASGLSAADRLLVSSVKVTIVVQTSLTDDSNPVRLENTVGMPNLGFAEESP